MSRLEIELGVEGLVLKRDRVVKVNGREEEIFFIIHPIMLK
jgi:hypothetical protein